MWNDEKSKYLFAFEAEVYRLIGGKPEKIPPGVVTGMWCNAHMNYGQGIDVKVGANNFYTDVIKKYHSHILEG